MCEIWHLLQGVARVPSNESQIVSGFLIKFKMLKPLWNCTKRQFLSKPSPAWFSLEPPSIGSGLNRRCGSAILIQIENHESQVLLIDFGVVSRHLLIHWPFTGHLLCARLSPGSSRELSHLVLRPTQWSMCSLSFYRVGNQGTERLSNWSKVTQLTIGKA